MPKSDSDGLREACEKYLASKPVVLWGDWEITNENSLKEAAQWLEQQVRDVMSHYEEPT